MSVDNKTVREGEWISVDGTTGNVFIGKVPMTAASLEEQTELMTLLKWADEICARPRTPCCAERLADARLAGLGERRLSKGRRAARVHMARSASVCAEPSTCSSSRSDCRLSSE